MSSFFKLSYYEKTLAQALSDGYDFLTTSDCMIPRDKKIVLRHDIDHDISLCRNFLKIEKRLGIKATYYFRTQAKNYNLFSKDSMRIVESAIDSGHEIGYHYEFPFLCADKNLDFFIKNLDLIRCAFGKKIKVVSPHEPTRSKSGTIDRKKLKSLGIKYDAYDKKIMKEFKYISDSSCNWREGPMHEHLNVHDSLYILTHPIWWFKKSPGECY